MTVVSAVVRCLVTKATIRTGRAQKVTTAMARESLDARTWTNVYPTRATSRRYVGIGAYARARRESNAAY